MVKQVYKNWAENPNLQHIELVYRYKPQAAPVFVDWWNQLQITLYFDLNWLEMVPET